MYCLFALNKYLFFVIVPAPYQMGKNDSRLVRQFQRAIVCPQRTKTGEGIEVWPSPKVAVPGQIIVIFTKIENFDFSL